jgi:hypothetical protein
LEKNRRWAGRDRHARPSDGRWWGGRRVDGRGSSWRNDRRSSPGAVVLRGDWSTALWIVALRSYPQASFEVAIDPLKRGEKSLARSLKTRFAPRWPLRNPRK